MHYASYYGDYRKVIGAQKRTSRFSYFDLITDTYFNPKNKSGPKSGPDLCVTSG
jgi:hypothetical protein